MSNTPSHLRDSDEPGSAALSVVLVTPDTGLALGRVLRCLGRQSMAARIEVIIAAPDPAQVALPENLGAVFHRVAVVPADVSTSACGRAAAIRASRTPIVALAEDHCFPVDECWAERIVAAHDADIAAVGPCVGNANPATGRSWANLAIEYGPWLAVDRAQSTDRLPGHNTYYKRAALLAYDNQLEDLLEAEYVLHQAMHRAGQRLVIDPRLRVEHLNQSKPGISRQVQYLSGRMFAASRAHAWPWPRRLLYGLGAPLIPPLRLARAIGHLLRLDQGPRLAVKALPTLIVILLWSGYGECVGYLFGDGGRRTDLADHEFDRGRFVIESERALAQ
ncbi:MAG: hypothetical protein ACFB3T_14215 [Geminicoccaceae bacterium]